ncbi:MAG: sulfatase [Pirellulales bacterium]
MAVSSIHADNKGEKADSDRVPNIVLILADDLGYADLGCMGSEYYETPHIDALARDGVRFTSAYTNAPNCAPTRAALLSGRQYPNNPIYTVGSGARGNADRRKLIPADNDTTLPTEFFTLAEALQGAGYRTCHVGKWHLGTPGEAGPQEQGFDVNIAGNHSGSPQGGYFSPYRNPQLENSGPRGEYLTDRLTDEAIQFIEDNRDKPFFLYMSHYAVHTPIQAKPSLTRKYADKTGRRGHDNAAYAAMIESLDDSVGRLWETLQRLDLADNTWVVFYSDNGGLGGYGPQASNITHNFPLRGGKGMLYEGGIRVPLLIRHPSGTPRGATCDVPVTSIDFYPTLLELCGVEPPAGVALDGESIVPLLKDPAAGRLKRQALTWHFPGYLQGYGTSDWRTTPAGAIRLGNYKLIEFFEDGTLELYNLADDVGEKNNLVEAKPEVAKKLHNALVAWREQVQAPMPRRK